MKKFLKILLIALLISSATIAYALPIFNGNQGGTGIGTATTTDVGNCLTVSSSSPYLIWSISPCASGFTTSTLAGLTATSWNLYTTTTPGITTSSPNNIYIGPYTAYLQVANNLSDLQSSSTARTNLGLGTIATHPESDYLSSSTQYVSSLSSANGLVTLDHSTGTITLTASSSPTFSNITDTGITGPSFVAVDANGLLIATTTPSSGSATTTQSINIVFSQTTSTKTYNLPEFTFNDTSTIRNVWNNSYDTGNTLTYNLYLGTTNPPTLNRLFATNKTIGVLSSPTTSALLMGFTQATSSASGKGFVIDNDRTATTSLSSYWPLEGNATDVWGTNDGTVTNVSFSNSYGNVGQRGAFNGASSVIIGTSTINIPTNASVGCWFNTTTTPAGGVFPEICGLSDNSASGVLFHIAQYASTGKIFGQLRDSAGVSAIASSTSDYNDGIWHYAALTKASNTITLYIDGSSVATSSLTPSGNFNGTKLHMGNYDTGLSQWYLGYADEFLYSTKVLSAQNITDFYSSRLGDPLYSATSTYPTASPGMGLWIKANTASTTQTVITVNYQN